MSTPPIPPPRKTDAFNIGYQRRIADAVNAGARLAGSGGIDVEATPSGRTIVDRRYRAITEITFGRVVDTGPLGTEDDFDSDENRYWVSRRRPVITTVEDQQQVALALDESPDGDKIQAEAAEGEPQDDAGYLDEMIVVATDVLSEARRFAVDDYVMMVGVVEQVPATGEMEYGYVLVGAAGGLTLRNDDDTLTQITGVTTINIPASTTNVLEFVEVEPGKADLRIKEGEDYQGIFCVDGIWSLDHVRARGL